MGIFIPGKNKGTTKLGAYQKLPDSMVPKIIELYESGLGIVKIGKILKCSSTPVRFIMNKFNIKRRSDDYRKIQLDDQFFKVIDTPEKAYWLGLLLTDGNVYGTRVCINLIDKEHLLKFAKCLGIKDLKISTHYKKQWVIYRLQFRSKEMVKDLALLGVVPRKSMICKPWTGPEELMSHFWRGCIDGDNPSLT